MVQRNRNNENKFIGAIIQSATQVTLTWVEWAKNIRNKNIGRVDELMYNYAYLKGLSLENIKNANIKLYRAAPKIFKEKYEYWIRKREFDMAQGTHIQQQQINTNRTLTIIFAIVAIVLVFLIVKDLKK